MTGFQFVNLYSIAVSDSGTTRIPVPKSNGKMTVKLIGIISGKKVIESVDVRVKGAKRAKPVTLPDGFNEEIQGTEAYPEGAVFLLGHVPVLQDCRHVEQDERGR